MTNKVFELETQLATLQMIQRTQDGLISIFVKNMGDEINGATNRAKAELESAALHLKRL